MSALSPGLLDAFALAAGELGMFSAARLFCAELHQVGGAPLVAELQTLIGPVYPVLDAVAGPMVAGAPLPQPEARPVLQALDGVARVVVIGAEAWVLDALTEGLPASVEIGVVLDATLPANAARVAANLEGRASLCAVDEVMRWSGSKTALVTAVYGTDGYRAAVCTAWLRLMGADTRSCFGALVGWNLLGPAMDAYPRWLQDTLVDDFTWLSPSDGAPISDGHAS